MEHNKGIPGIFFKFDLDPMSLSIHQRTTSLLQLLIRYVIARLKPLSTVLLTR